MRIDGEDIDEDELLADSPPSTPTVTKGKQIAHNKGSVSDSSAPTVVSKKPIFSNRRVVVRNATTSDATHNENLSDKPTITTTTTTATTTGKGIFDRLDKKVISVNEAAKRKIQRIVINSSE